MPLMDNVVKLRIEYRYDPESRNWCFVVPSLGIIGGGKTRQAAEELALDAIAFTLESENEAEPPASGEIAYLNLTVVR